MSITITLDSYSDWCQTSHFGRQMLEELTGEMIERLDELFDDQTFEESSNQHPDNIYVNALSWLTHKQVLVEITQVMSEEEFENLDDVVHWLLEAENDTKVTNAMIDNDEHGYVLGWNRNGWATLQ